MDWPEMVVAIVAISAFAGIWRSKLGIRRDKGGSEIPIDNRENVRLRDEVKALKDRIAVIERITVEKESSLEREIERLRDK